MLHSKQLQVVLPRALTILSWCIGAGLGLVTVLLPAAWASNTQPLYILRLEALLFGGVAVMLGIILLSKQQSRSITRTGVVLIIANIWAAMLWLFRPEATSLYVPHHLLVILAPALLIWSRPLPHRRILRLLPIVETLVLMSFVDVVVQLTAPRLIASWTSNPEVQLTEWRWLTTISACYWYQIIYRRFSNLHSYPALVGILGIICFLLGDSVFLWVIALLNTPIASKQSMLFTAPFWITQQLCWVLTIYGISQTNLTWSSEPQQRKLCDRFSWIVPIQRGLILVGIALGLVLGPVPPNVRAFFIMILVLYEVLNAYEREQLRQADRIARDKLEKANQQLTAYTRQAEELATLRERERMARDMHDSTGSTFSRITYIARVGSSHLDTDATEARTAFFQIQQEADTGLENVRRAVRNLQDTTTLQRSLPELIQSEIERVKPTGLDARLESTGEPYIVPPHVTSELWRIVQESFTNVRRHAQATEVIVYLDYRANKKLNLTIEDDGQGCDLSTVVGGFGIQSMRERAKQIGTELIIWSRPGHGLQIHVEVPL